MSDVGTKRPREEEDESDLGEPTYAVKKKTKLALPPRFPDPHTFMEKIRHPWEQEFEPHSTEIRMKPDWTKKVFDETITNKWKEELAAKGHSWMWKRLLAELQYLATLSTAEAEPSAVDGVWLKDGVVPKELHDKFVKQVAERLESKPKEYHPYSNDTVVDLVHPALYCYVHGKSRTNEDPFHSQLREESHWKTFLASGRPACNPTLEDSLKVIEKAKGWTDADKDAAEERREAEEENEEEEEEQEAKLTFDPSLLFIDHVPVDPYNSDEDTSNNEPKRILANHLASHFRWLPADVSVNMYGKIQFDSYINGLHPFDNKELYESISQVMEHFLPLWGCVLRDLTYDPLPHARDRVDMSDRGEEALYGVSDYTLSEEYEQKVKDNKDGDVEVLQEFKEPSLAPPLDFSRSALKVIVKIASIELTPEKPEYNGTWHIEGVPEEGIISTGIYYFDEENIQDNYLQFRMAHGDPDDTDVQCPMGLGFGSQMNREAGRVQTKQGRLLAFPNIMQHCVSGISLEDKTKPGHRKLLVFFLVDPHKNSQVLSTGQVPPPCKEWYENKGVKVDESTLQTLEEARLNRENLMFTRKFYVVSQNENYFERECTFCEH